MGTDIVHVGQKIKEFLVEKGIKQTYLAEKLSMSKNGIQNLLKRESLHIKQLQEVSNILGHDFVSDVANLSSEANDVTSEYRVSNDTNSRSVVVLTFEDGELIDIKRKLRDSGESLEDRLAKIEDSLRLLIEANVRNNM